MNIAVAVSDDKTSPTLGQTKEFVLLSDGMEERFFCEEKIPVFLKKHGVQLLICNGIGNCMLDLLSSMGIRVIPGIDKNLEEIKGLLESGDLTPGKHYSCTDHGQSCGACAGNF